MSKPAGWTSYHKCETRADANELRRNYEVMGFTTGTETRADGTLGVFVWAPRA